MIEAVAQVARVDDGDVVVTGRAQSACERCARGQGCGGGLLGRLVKRSGGTLHVQSPEFQVEVGDLVVLGVAERPLLAAMSAAYALPLLGMVLGAVFTALFLSEVDGIVALAGAVGLAAGGLAGRRLLSTGEAHARPQVLRKANAQELAHCGSGD